MANRIAIRGLSPVAYLNGAPYNGQARLYAIPTADTTASYAIGDIVQSAGGADADGIPYVRKIPAASASSFVALGVVVGVRVVDPGVSLVGSSISLENLFLTAGSRTVVRYVYVADDPNLVFSAIAGATTTNLVAAKARYNAGIGSLFTTAVGTDPTTQTYQIDQNGGSNANPLSPSHSLSIVCINEGSINTTPTLPLQLLGLSQRTDNTFGAYQEMLVRFNSHEFAVATGTNFTGL